MGHLPLAIAGVTAPTLEEATAAFGLEMPPPVPPDSLGHAGLWAGQQAALFDGDGDGDLDVWVTGGPQPEISRDRYFEGEAGRFDRAASAKCASVENTPYASGNWATGVQVGDLNADGADDIVTAELDGASIWWNGADAFARRPLSHQRGGWVRATALLDVNRDGELDVYLARAVDLAARGGPCHRRGLPAPCDAEDLSPLHDQLFLQGGGAFTDASQAWGLGSGEARPAADVKVWDLNADGWLDLVVQHVGWGRAALYNTGQGFEDLGLERGLAYDGAGQPSSGPSMCLIPRGDGSLPDLLVAGGGGESDVWLRAHAGDQFTEAPGAPGLELLTRGAATAQSVWADFTNTGDHVLLNVRGERSRAADSPASGTRFAQEDRLIDLSGPRVLGSREAPWSEWRASRGAVTGDLDADGDLDLILTYANEPLRAYANRTIELGGGDEAIWVRLVDGVAATATALRGERRVMGLVAAGGFNASDRRLHLGMGLDAKSLVVRWAGGPVDSLGTAAAGEELTVRRGHGVIERRFVGDAMR